MYSSRFFLSTIAVVVVIVGAVCSFSVAGPVSTPTPTPTSVPEDSCHLVGNLSTGVVLLRKMMVSQLERTKVYLCLPWLVSVHEC